jgi:hypothetical protein
MKINFACWALTVFMFAPCINGDEKYFIVPTDTLNNIKLQLQNSLETITIAPTCFGSYKNHPQGAVQYLDKTINKDLM